MEVHRDFWHQKTRVPGLSSGVVCLILSSAVLVKRRLVTDRHRPIAYTALAWRRTVKIIYTVTVIKYFWFLFNGPILQYSKVSKYGPVIIDFLVFNVLWTAVIHLGTLEI